MLILLVMAVVSVAAPTDFGVRSAMPAREAAQFSLGVSEGVTPARPVAANLALAAQIGAQFGRVTSTRRSVERNRLVGGVSNSWHLSGRAIDIVRSPSVTHGALAIALRRAGFFLIESLDEGDHSHFAFGTPGVHKPRIAPGGVSEASREASYFTFRRAPLAIR